MDDASQLIALLERTYGARVAGISPYFEGPDKAVYRVDRQDGPAWVARLFPAARSLERVEGDAAVLRYVAHYGVPAERLVVAIDGASTAELAGRGVLVTEHVRGVPLDRNPDSLRKLGDAIGWLHALPAAPSTDRLLSRRAGSLPREDLAFARVSLARIGESLPVERSSEYRNLWAALDAASDCEDLPHGLIHSDGHIANALLTQSGQVVLIDWDGAGQGPQVAALGLLLFTCAVQGPSDPDLSPDLDRVDYVLEGYLRHRAITTAERERLSDAVRIRPVVVAVRELVASVERRVPENQLGWWRRYREAEAVAARAVAVS